MAFDADDQRITVDAHGSVARRQMGGLLVSGSCGVAESDVGRISSAASNRGDRGQAIENEVLVVHAWPARFRSVRSAGVNAQAHGHAIEPQLTERAQTKPEHVVRFVVAV